MDNIIDFYTHMGKLLIEAHYTELCHDQTQSNQSDRLPG